MWKLVFSVHAPVGGSTYTSYFQLCCAVQKQATKYRQGRHLFIGKLHVHPYNVCSVYTLLNECFSLFICFFQAFLKWNRKSTKSTRNEIKQNKCYDQLKWCMAMVYVRSFDSYIIISVSNEKKKRPEMTHRNTFNHFILVVFILLTFSFSF